MSTPDAAESPIRLEVDATTAVAVVTMDNPPVNAVNSALIAALTETFRSFSHRRDVNCVVLTGAGRAFCAGMDLRGRGAARAANALDPGRPWREAKEAVLRCEVPVIAAVHGYAIGAGVGIASCCDIILAAEGARFGLTEMNVGALGGGSALMRMVGTYKMRAMFYTAELVPAEEMHRLGAVEKVVPAERLLEEALDMAGRIASKSPIGLRLAKESLDRMEEFLTPWTAAYRLEQDYTNRLGTFEDSKEGTRAFLEKRQPEWKWQ